ncbi:putative Bet v I/Major latex protein [Arabidopsis thaliana]
MAEEVSTLVGILETTVDLKSSTEKFHDMFVGRPHNISDVSPSNFQGCELHEGEMGQVGAILFWNYVTPKEGEPGSVAHWHFEYEKINEEVAHPETLLQFAIKVSKEIDEHLFSEE